MPKNQNAGNVKDQEANDNVNVSAQQAILAAISKLQEEVMGKIASTVSAHSDQLRGLQDTVEGWRLQRAGTLETEMLAVKRQVSTLKEQCEDLEARSCRCNVRIMRVKEGWKNGEKMSDFVAHLLKETLALDKLPLLDRAHHSLRSKPTDENALP
ncbi:hypothetical protein ABVT39_002054 [Epinephelus coioides]